MLNNRWFVFGLAGLAVLLIGMNVLRPLLDAREDDWVPPDDPSYYDVDIENDLTGTGIDTPLQGAQFDSAQLAISSINVAALHWDERPARDPYVPSATVSEAALNAVQAAVKSAPRVMTPTSVRWPTVSAVVDSRRHQYAVVDGEIRKPGDRFGGFELVGIEQQSVRLAHAATRSARQVKVSTK
ncbi:MAG: hypothetical protein AAFR91_02920 [Pseudomonadota bacterium]